MLTMLAPSAAWAAKRFVERSNPSTLTSKRSWKDCAVDSSRRTGENRPRIAQVDSADPVTHTVYVTGAGDNKLSMIESQQLFPSGLSWLLRCKARQPEDQQISSTLVNARRGVGGGGGSVFGAWPTRISTWGSAVRPVSRRTNSRLALTSIMCVNVQVASSAIVHSSSTVDNTSPHLSAFPRLSS